MRKTRARKNKKTGKWDIQYRYTDWQGKSLKSTKRGFPTKKAAEEYLRSFLAIKHVDFDMKFSEFVEVYYQDMEQRLRYHTMLNKKYIMEKKVLPYFGNMRMNQIKVATIRAWQNELMKQGYSATYLRTIHNQLSALFNYAVRYYDLSSNPCKRAGVMGDARTLPKGFWTKEEFNQFIECVMDKQQSYIAFTTLYWTGIRIGELLALTLQDIDFNKMTISINKSYQRLGGKDIITPPKTPKSKRIIHIPQSLAVDLKDYTDSFYEVQPTDRIFPFMKYFIEAEMKRGIKLSGVKKIRVHDLRHSHASFLVEKGFTPLEIAERLGHEKIETTLNTYSHLYPNKQEQLAKLLDGEYLEETS